MEVFGVEAELDGGFGGVYDIRLDDKLIFSKHGSGNRFPLKGEIIGLIKAEVSAE